MKRISFWVLCCLLAAGGNVQAQHATNWYFPEGVGIRFDGFGAHSLAGGKVATTVPANVKLRATEGSACISDSKGNLLFYTDGVTVWNRNHEPMANGKGLKGGPSTTQPASIVPDPGNPSRFYIFTLDDFQHVLKNGLCYSVVDICLNNGLGDVTDKNIPLLDLAGEKQAITKHQNDTDFWLVVHKHYTSSFYAYKISRAGVSKPVVSTIGSYHGGGLFDGAATSIGQMKISPDGTQVGLINANLEHGDDKALMELFTFNKETGAITSYINLTDLIYQSFQGFYGGYGFSFSPNGQNIYVFTTRGVLQFHNNNGWWSYAGTVAQSSSFLQQIFGMQLAPNGKIYIAKGEPYLASIPYPDQLYPACGFVLNDVFLDDGLATWSLPGFYDGFRYTHADPVCSPDEGRYLDGNTECGYFVYPNPATDYLNIRVNNDPIKDIRFYNMIGQQILEIVPGHDALVTIDTRNLVDNCYLVVITKPDGTFCTTKVVKRISG